jgi:geranylgeranyl diphosphate synthase, type II
MHTLEEYKAEIDKTLDALIPASPSSLYKGGRHALLAPGKRIRPLLTLCTTQMLQQQAVASAVIPACALEMVHAYSLIHDDLPCMDDDDFRRGLPTLHRVYTEGHAVLMGDYLLTYAFEVIATAPILTAEQKVALMRTLSHAAGGEGMIGGQVMDIENSPHIEEMHACKTAALFRASVEFGGIIAGATSEILSLLRNFGMQFGKLFQMVDDFLDKDHPLGEAKALEGALAHYNTTLHTLARLPGDTSSLHTLADLIFTRTKLYQSEE